MSIVDVCRYFLFANKSPHINIVTSFISTHGLKSDLGRVKNDQRRKLTKSGAFRKCTTDAGYTLEVTGVSASFQNGIVERPHRTLVNMMRSMISGASLMPNY